MVFSFFAELSGVFAQRIDIAQITASNTIVRG
jgi:hypothetical protein